MASRIEDYALLGDCRSAALVSRDGSVDWLCLPRFDSAALFAALLGDDSHGHWRIAPAEDDYRVHRRYLGDSMVLETTFETATGVCRLLDGMLLDRSDAALVRIVEGVRGEVALAMDLTIRFDYGSVVPWVRATGTRSFHAIAGPDAVEFVSPVEIENRDFRTRAEFTVRAGDRLPFQLLWHPSNHDGGERIEDPGAALDATVRTWERWADRCTLAGEGRERLVRSLLCLKALTYQPTGGIVAAPTTSLPEHIGGTRNWDYRYCWVRDATYTLYAMVLTGYREEAAAWVDWLVRAVAGTPSQVNIMYGLAGERRLPELELDWLPGYEGSRPVRTGNAAWGQLQLDIFGELMDTAAGVQERDPDQPDVVERLPDHDGPPPTDLVRAGRGDLGGAGRATAVHPLEGHGLGGVRPGGQDRSAGRLRGADRRVEHPARSDPCRGVRARLHAGGNASPRFTAATRWTRVC